MRVLLIESFFIHFNDPFRKSSTPTKDIFRPLNSVLGFSSIKIKINEFFPKLRLYYSIYN
jgi:hypothetical protein